jgi:tartrate-resistant acid phosphatase type 5
LEVPWYIIAGNHDHLGNIQAQIDYTHKSKKWTFPNYFYKAQYAFGKANTLVDIIFIDTIVLCGQTFDVEGRSLFSWLGAKSLKPENPEKKYEKLAEIQWKWIENELANSNADYIFVVGHYPIYTNAGISFKCLESRLDPLLRKYRVNAYLSGHDHNLQHFFDDGKDSGSQMRYIISGAGSRIGTWKLFKRHPSNIRLEYL